VLEGLLHLFASRPWQHVVVDVVDLLAVTYVIYRALLVLRGTRAMQMGTGLGLIFILYIVAKLAGLLTLFNLLSTLLSSVILVVVVVFQNDIRRGLMRVGARAILVGTARQQESRVVDEVVAAATELARHRIGALICFEQDANLDEFVVGQGTALDAAVQRDLLVSLFVPDSLNKLHDGAVVIRNLRLAKAGVFFPMLDTKILDKSLGSRHRAALGITEETDAMVVVVSEERGAISACFRGRLVQNLDGASLKETLLGLFGQRESEPVASSKRRSDAAERLAVAPSSVRTTLVSTTPHSPSLPLSPSDLAALSVTQSSRGVPEPEDSVPRRPLDASVPRPMPPAMAVSVETPVPMPRSAPPGPRKVSE